MRPRERPARRSSGTRRIASNTIERDILDPPATRSANVIGTSSHREAEQQRAIGHLDLELVALRIDRVELDRLQHARAGSTCSRP